MSKSLRRLERAYVDSEENCLGGLESKREIMSDEDSEGWSERPEDEEDVDDADEKEDEDLDEQSGGGNSGDCEMSRLRAVAMVVRSQEFDVTYVTHRL